MVREHSTVARKAASAQTPRPWRVLHVITRLVRGGADENTLITLAGLDPTRYTVDLAVGSESEVDSMVVPAHVRVRSVPHLVREVHPVRDLLAFFELVRLIRTGAYDLVHTHTAKAGVIGRLAAALVRVPVVIHTLHGTTFHQHTGRWSRRIFLLLESLAARCTNGFISVSDDVGDRYVEAGVIKPAAYRTIYSGMNVDRFSAVRDLDPDARRSARRECGVAEDDAVVAVVARLEPRKGHRYLFEAIARLTRRHDDLRLLVVGDGALREELVHLARRLGIADAVRFLGHRDDIDRVLAATDIVALASLWEGLPRILVQAALAGRPVVTFDVEGVREVVRDGENGYIVPPGDLDRFTDRLRALLDDPERARAMGREQGAEIAERWSSSRMVGDIESMYEQLFEAAA